MDSRSGDTDRADAMRPLPQAVASRKLQVLLPPVRHVPRTECVGDTPCQRGTGDPDIGDEGIRAECEHCGGPLPDGSSANRMYCGKECKKVARTASARAARTAVRQGRKCLWCSAPIPAEAPGNTIFCSSTCKARSWEDMKKTRRTCRQCGASYRGSGPFCSHPCYADSRRKRHPKQCPICQKTFKPSYMEQVCCSLVCRDERAKRGRSGSNGRADLQSCG